MNEYNQKRNFAKTPEPPGKPSPSTQQLHFVVQHHFARREHYDFRLERNGALKSWAVPKGPSPNPADRRLAVQVEDHPLDYRHFEGTIPPGQYGAGTVSIWDSGTYEPLEWKDGSIKLVLHGQKLTGAWALVRMRDGQDKNWLLIKEKSDQNQNPFPHADPQLARLVTDLPAGDGWLYELKYDGYRILSFVEHNHARLLTRNGSDYARKFPSAAQALVALAAGRAMVLDGEMVVADAAGRPDFQALQGYLKHPGNSALQYIIFDLLALDGQDLRPLPLLRRKELLAHLLTGAPAPLHYSVHINGHGEALLEAARAARLEGIVGKRADSSYTGTRNGDWVKRKCAARQEFVIGGYTVSAKRAPGGVSSLLLGVYRGGALVYCGRAGGFSRRDMDDLAARFRPLARKTPPFREAPQVRAGEAIYWLRPQLAAEISFAEWTREGLLRQAKLKGLRTDKDIKQVEREDLPVGAATSRPHTSMDGCVVEGVKLTHPDKLAAPGVTKKDLALYYQKVAPRMLPYIEGRYLSAIRCPGGAEGECFFKKHPDGDKESYYCVNDAAGLIAEVQRNTVELHVWGSRADTPDRPDVMVFDLDPDEGLGLEAVRQGARDLKRILDGLNLKSYLKTSGGKGYHVVVPFQPSMDWDAFRDFAKGIVGILTEQWPERYTGSVRKASRGGKIFVDWIRNTRGATSAAPYSVRKRPGMPVSMPIAWGELGRVAPGGIDMAEALKRLKRKDPWEGFWANCSG
ncbi:MAG: DNA ligase D [Oscillospiraceae bacterium]|nr:DNA ligase D [Oscillospiraceae bacterium]